MRRSYSICAAAQDAELRVGIKKIEGGLFSSWANERIVPGDAIEAMPPMGNFHLPLDPQARHHYLGFAAGSGITPLLSIVKTTLAAEPHEPLHAGLRQPRLEHDHVPRGAGGPEERPTSTASR